MRKTHSYLIWVLALVVAAPLACHADTPNPYLKPDDSYISISGKAVEIQASGFTLDYGTGTVLVEMDDWDWYDESNGVLEGDNVTVYGKIDDDLYETTKIEASSVYVEDLGTYFYASPADEEGATTADYWVVGVPIVLGQTTVRGTVSSVNGREFTIDTGPRKLTVDTSEMLYNPLDSKGYHQIDKGDYVSATGHLEEGFWDSYELEADSVITLESN